MRALLAVLLAASPTIASGAISAPPGALLPEQPVELPPVALFALDDQRFVFAGRLDLEGGPLLVPMRSLSPREPLFTPQDGVRVRLALTVPEGGAVAIDRLSVEALRHGTEQRLVRTPAGLLLLANERLPRAVRHVAPESGDVPGPHTPDALARLARRDLAVLAGGHWTARAQQGCEGYSWVLTGAETEEFFGRPTWTVRDGEGNRHRLPSGPNGALLIGYCNPLEIDLGDAQLEALSLARVTSPPEQERVRLDTEDCREYQIERQWRRRHAGAGPWRLALELGREGESRPAAELLKEVDRRTLPLSGGRALVWSGELPAPASEGSSWTLIVRAYGEIAAREPADPLPTESAGTPWFEDVAPTLGVDLVHLEGPAEQLDIRPTMGPGAAWGDVDGDGWPDLYLVQGGGRDGCEPLTNRLFRNRRGEGFEDITERAGVGDRGAGMGAIFFDLEGDGDLDLYVANYGPDVLYRNDGDGHFEDVSERFGVGGDLWSAGVAASDYDRDGDLDLVVTSYLDYDLSKLPPPEELTGFRREDPLEMLPFAFPGQRNTFLRNETHAPEPRDRFVDLTSELGLLDEQGRGMQPIFWDFDQDGDDDLYVANDVSFNVLYQNQGDGSFRDISFQAGLDDPRGGMGLDVGDVDGDGDEDLFLTNWELEANALYLNNTLRHAEGRHHVASFRDATVRAGLGPYGVGVTSWAGVFLDVENDGDLDLYVANGYTSPDYRSTGTCMGQPDHLFLGDGHGRFRAAFDLAGPDATRLLPSRAAVPCDYDRDGRVDLLVTANNGPVRLLHNVVPDPGHWLGVSLRAAGGNTRAIGAVLRLRLPGGVLVRSVRCGRGYLGGNAPDVHFGLGSAEPPLELEIRWPSGRVTRHEIEALDRWLTLTESGR